MTSRERVIRTVHFKTPDRVPHYLPDGKENDILWLWPDRPVPKQDWHRVGDHDHMIDPWGVVFQRMAGGVLGRGEVLRPALSDVSREADFVFPDLNNLRYLKTVTQQIRENRKSNNPRYALGVMPFSSLNEGIHNITGIQNLFLAYYEYPDHLKRLITRFAAAQKESIRLLAETGCDGIMAYDDWGLQDSLMISRAMIREFFLPSYRENWSYARSLGMDIWMHSCGYIIELLPDLIDAGLNVIQMDQQENMGLNTLAGAVGGRLAFWCPVDIQRTMIEGTLEEIDVYARDLIAILGTPAGGFISMAYSTPDDIQHTPEKLSVMCASFRRNESLHAEPPIETIKGQQYE
jgi:uroporphyrinogen decarboxylase